MNFFYNPDKQVQYLKAVLNIQTYDIVLDVGCEDGYHLKKIQQIAPDSVGIDVVAPLNELANFELVSIFDYSPSIEFDNAYLLAPFFYDDWNKYDTLFKKLHNLIKLEGRVVLDLYNFNGYRIGKGFQQYKKFPKKIILSEFVKEQDRMVCHRTIKLSDWSEINKELKWKVFSHEELIVVLEENNFRLIDIHADFDENISLDRIDEIDNKLRRSIVIEKCS